MSNEVSWQVNTSPVYYQVTRFVSVYKLLKSLQKLSSMQECLAMYEEVPHNGAVCLAYAATFTGF